MGMCSASGLCAGWKVQSSAMSPYCGAYELGHGPERKWAGSEVKAERISVSTPCLPFHHSLLFFLLSPASARKLGPNSAQFARPHPTLQQRSEPGPRALVTQLGAGSPRNAGLRVKDHQIWHGCGQALNTLLHPLASGARMSVISVSPMAGAFHLSASAPPSAPAGKEIAPITPNCSHKHGTDNTNLSMIPLHLTITLCLWCTWPKYPT